jgi:tetratricopeptide (TPR) repeat protein
MSLWTWLFPTAETRLARAREALQHRRFREARDDIDGLEGPEADAIRKDAMNGLAALNLEAALEYGMAGQDERCAEHLQMAEGFHQGGMEERFREVRRTLRETRESRKAAIVSKRSNDARAAAVDPLGLVGRALLAENAEPDLSPDDEEKAARLALVVENYPEDLRDRVKNLGPRFGSALLELEDGRPDLALQTLLDLDDADPLVQFERGRCCWALGDPAAAARAFQAFAKAILPNGQPVGHRPIAADHTGVLLAQALVDSGDRAGAVAVLRSLRATDPLPPALLLANLLLANESSSTRAADLAEAELAVRDVLVKVSKPSIWAFLGLIRLAAGQRVPAMQAYESALSLCCDSPGKCGTHKPEPGLKRALATLYLEDGMEVPRALELAESALDAADPPAWEDLYLDALVARVTSAPEAAESVAAMWARTRADDPRREVLARHLPR